VQGSSYNAVQRDIDRAGKSRPPRYLIELATTEYSALMPRRRSRPTSSLQDSRRIPDLVIESAWLVGLISVPLVSNMRGWLTFYNDPKYVALHLVALVITAAWAWERALYSQPYGLPGLTNASKWIGRQPERWALVAAATLGAVAVLSTIGSPVRTTSLWGRNFTDLGYELYSFLSFLIIFFAVAMRVRSESQVRRLLIAFVVAGTIAAMYGMGQRYGWDPIGSGENASRIFASFGNPIHLGSFLVMTAVLTPVVALSEGRRSRYLWLAVGALALGVQLIALWYTGSRGPWLGYAAGVVAFVGIGLVWLDRRTLSQGLAVIAAAVVIAILIAQIPLPAGGGGAERTLADVGRIFEDSASTSVGGRGLIWESILDVSADRIWSPEESTGAGVVRTLFGYGPEMFFYAYPLGIDVDYSGSIAAHAHNYPLQIFVELGVLGLGSIIALALLVLYAGVQLLNTVKSAGTEERWASLIVVGLVATLAGRAVEQMAGVARLGDLVPFWILLGLLIAIIEITKARSSGFEGKTKTVESGRRPRILASSGPRGAYIGLAVVVTVLAVGLLYFRDVRIIQASAIARDGAVLGHEGDVNRALEKYQRAADLNPDVEQYHETINDLFRGAANAAEDAGDTDLAEFGWQSALDAAKRYTDRNSKSFDMQGRVGQAESRLVGLGREDLLEDARNTYLNFADARPAIPGVQSSAAQGFLAIEDDILGLVYADRALEMETPEHPDVRSWWFRGVALQNLGELALAVLSYETAVERDSESLHAVNARKQLVMLYGELGEPEKAAEHQLVVDQYE
jgi:tetratricopeptide (TPR) repeat protein/O-antigen ligase